MTTIKDYPLAQTMCLDPGVIYSMLLKPGAVIFYSVPVAQKLKAPAWADYIEINASATFFCPLAGYSNTRPGRLPECLVKDILENSLGWANPPRGPKSLAFGGVIKRLLAKVSKNGKAKLADGWVVIIRERSDLRAGIVELDESMFASTANHELRVPASKDRRVRCRYLPSMQERWEYAENLSILKSFGMDKTMPKCTHHHAIFGIEPCVAIM